MKALKSTVGIALALFVTAATTAIADEPQMPQMTAEHESLGMWVGTWSGTGEMKPGPFGDGGPMSWTETCSWFEGGKFHVVCKSKGEGPMGPMKGLGIMGYNAEKKVYTYYGVDNTGWSGYSEGTRSGDTWTYQNEELMGGKTYHSRFTLAMKSDTKITMTWEMSEDGANWAVMMEGTSKRMAK